MEELEAWIEHGVGFYPVNREGAGEEVVLLYADGTSRYLRRSVRMVLNSVVRFFGADVAALREQYGKAIGRKQLIPLPLSHDWILVPFKVRKPIGKQPCYGWFVSAYICGLEPNGRLMTRLQLSAGTPASGGHEVLLYESFQTCQQQMRHVTLVRQRYLEIHGMSWQHWIAERKVRYFH